MLAECPRAGIAKDCEKFDLGSYTEWDRLIRGCLLWLGYADPVTTQEGIEDPMKGANLHTLAAWYGMWGEEEHTIHDIGCRPETELHQALRGSRRDWDPGVVSHKLRKLRDRVIGDYKLVKVKESTHGTRYRVMWVGKKPAPSSDPVGVTKNPKQPKFSNLSAWLT